MEPVLQPIHAEEEFSFSCDSSRSCFNFCCRDLNQFLTPYDTLRLRQGLGLSSEEFIDHYTLTHMGPKTSFPILSLRPNGTGDKKCPFVTSKGCQVYGSRPSSCRIYPLMRLARRDRITGNITESFFLIKEPHCLGFHSTRNWSARRWMQDQELSAYNRFNDLMLDIISQRNKMPSGPLASEAIRLFSLALYQIDLFRSQILDGVLPYTEDFKGEAVSAAIGNDADLLVFAHSWIKRILFSPKSS